MKEVGHVAGGVKAVIGRCGDVARSRGPEHTAEGMGLKLLPGAVGFPVTAEVSGGEHTEEKPDIKRYITSMRKKQRVRQGISQCGKGPVISPQIDQTRSNLTSSKGPGPLDSRCCT